MEEELKVCKFADGMLSEVHTLGGKNSWNWIIPSLVFHKNFVKLIYHKNFKKSRKIYNFNQFDEQILWCCYVTLRRIPVCAYFIIFSSVNNRNGLVMYHFWPSTFIMNSLILKIFLLFFFKNKSCSRFQKT